MFLCAGTVVLLQFQTISEDDVNSIVFGNQVKYPVSMKSITRSLFAEEQFGPDTPSVSGNMPGNTPGISPDIPTDVSMYTNMPMSERWKLLTAGRWSDNPGFVYSQGDANWQSVESLRAQMEVRITVKTWQYKSTDSSNYDTELREVSFLTSKAVAPCLVQIFKEMESSQYSMYPLYISEKGYSVRNVKDTTKYSKHSFGGALDVNASAAAGGYSNDYSSTIPYCSDANWNAIPKSKEKYKVFYQSHPLVLTFKKYGWCWGGAWDGKRDGMHFGYLGG